jgi:hypothetical protein
MTDLSPYGHTEAGPPQRSIGLTVLTVMPCALSVAGLVVIWVLPTRAPWTLVSVGALLLLLGVATAPVAVAIRQKSWIPKAALFLSLMPVVPGTLFLAMILFAMFDR